MPPLHKPPPTATLLIQQCAAARSLREARQLHALLLTSEPSPTEAPLFIHNNIVSMYARCGSFPDAQLLFDKMPQRNVVSYNSLISAYSRAPRHAHLAYILFNQLENEGLAPNGLTFTSLLQASAGLGDLVFGSSLHGRIVRSGLSDNVRVQTSLLGMYSSCRNMGSAKRVFCHMVDKDVVTWNSMISAYVKNGELAESLELFRNMLREGVDPIRFTYSLVLNACAKLQDYDFGKVVHARVLLSSTCIDLPLQNSLLDMYCSCKDIRSAEKVFSRIKNPDLISWNSILGGYSEKGEIAMDMFIRFMRVSHYEPDEYTFAAVISATSWFPARDYGRPLHAQTEKAGLCRRVYIGSTLISMYFNNEDLVSSRKLFDSFPHKDVVLWTDMISGHVRMGESGRALNFFLEMTKTGCSIDSFALSSALSACGDLVTLKQGEMIHSLAIKTGNNSEVYVNSSLVDMYAKNGELEAAMYTFSSCPPKSDVMCWNSMLTGYGNHGKADEAFIIFFKMLKHGLKPDQVTLLSLLSACNHCGLVGESRFFWNYMRENQLMPGRKHYSCMISLLSRVGMWEEAEVLIKESPFSDDCLEYWRIVLSSCVENGNLRGGIFAAEKILEVDAGDCGANLLLTKLYSEVGRWDDVLETRRMGESVVKCPGLSWINE